MPASCSISACLDSADPTKPTGTPTIPAGRGPPSLICSSRWNSAVGALPMATRAPSSRSPHSDTAAADRVVPHALASSATARSLRWQITSLPAGGHKTGVDAQVLGEVWLPGGVHHPHRDVLGVGRDSGQVGLRPDNGERLPVDLRAVRTVRIATQRPGGHRAPSRRPATAPATAPTG